MIHVATHKSGRGLQKDFIPLSVYFALDCQVFDVPRLHYIGIQTEPLDVAKLGNGLSFPFNNISSILGYFLLA